MHRSFMLDCCYRFGAQWAWGTRRSFSVDFQKCFSFGSLATTWVVVCVWGGMFLINSLIDMMNNQWWVELELTSNQRQFCIPGWVWNEWTSDLIGQPDSDPSATLIHSVTDHILLISTNASWIWFLCVASAVRNGIREGTAWGSCARSLQPPVQNKR